MNISDLSSTVKILLTRHKTPDGWRADGAQSLRRVFEDAGYVADLEICGDVDAIKSHIRTATRPGDIVAIGGGDGTINAVLDAVCDASVILLALPMGTANDFARSLKLPDDPIQAAQAAINGQLALLDIGRVNGQSFVNAASIGVPADARRRINPDLKRWTGALSYAVANWQSWHDLKPLELSVQCAGKPPQDWKLRQLTVTNGQYFGGGLRPSETKSPEDGLLHVFAIRDSVDTLSGLDVAAGLLFGSVDDSTYAITMECNSITVTGEDGAPILADGEIIGELPATFTIRPAVLPVFAPNSFVNHAGPDAGNGNLAPLAHQAQINDILHDSLDFALRLEAIFPVAQNSDLRALCHDGARHLRDICRQLELGLRPHGIPSASPDPDLHSLEELRDRVMGWLLENADQRLAHGLKARAELLATEIGGLSTRELPDAIHSPLRGLNGAIGDLISRLGSILKTL